MKSNRTFWQYVMLLGSSALSALLNFAVTLLLTNAMSADDYGAYRYAVTFLSLAGSILQLGISYSASLLLTRADSPAEESRIIRVVSGAMAGIAIVIGGVLTAVLTVSAHFGAEIEVLLIAVAPFVVVPTMQYAFIEMLKGANRIGLLSIQTAAPYFLILCGGLAYFLLAGRISVAGVVSLHFVAYGMTHLITLILSGARTRGHWRRILTAVRPVLRVSGIHIYTGALVGVASVFLVNLIVGSWVGYAEYATLSLAIAVSLPVQMIPATMGNVLFRRNASAREISRRAWLVTVSSTVVVAVLYGFVLQWLVPKMFPGTYGRVAYLALALIVAYSLYGLGDFFNRFVGAHGDGISVRRASMASGIGLAAVSLGLASRIGIEGAVIGTVAGGAVYCLLLIHRYRRLAAELRAGGPTPSGMGGAD